MPRCAKPYEKKARCFSRAYTGVGGKVARALEKEIKVAVAEMGVRLGGWGVGLSSSGPGHRALYDSHVLCIFSVLPQVLSSSL